MNWFKGKKERNIIPGPLGWILASFHILEVYRGGGDCPPPPPPNINMSVVLWSRCFECAYVCHPFPPPPPNHELLEPPLYTWKPECFLCFLMTTPTLYFFSASYDERATYHEAGLTVPLATWRKRSLVITHFCMLLVVDIRPLMFGTFDNWMCPETWIGTEIWLKSIEGKTNGRAWILEANRLRGKSLWKEKISESFDSEPSATMADLMLCLMEQTSFF